MSLQDPVQTRDVSGSLTPAVMVLLGTEGLRIPGLDYQSGRERYGPIPLGFPELVLLQQLCDAPADIEVTAQSIASATGADHAKLVAFISKLRQRGLITVHGGSRPCTDRNLISEARAFTPDSLVSFVCPRFFEIRREGFACFTADGATAGIFSPRQMLALSELRLKRKFFQSFEAQSKSGAALALSLHEYESLIGQLDRAGLLEVDPAEIDPSLRLGRPGVGRERAAERDWARFQTLNERVRIETATFDDEERQREAMGGSRRVRVVSCHQNGTIYPLALGMIVAYAKAFEGGRLERSYKFHPDWVIRPAKVRHLTSQPAVFLFSNYNWSHRHNLSISKKVKEVSPWSVTIHGGPNTPKYEMDVLTYLHDNPDVDIAVRGEGEVTVAEILAALEHSVGDGPPDFSDLHDVKGVSFRHNGKVIITPDRERLTELDVIPSPIVEGYFKAFAGSELGIIETNRGCPYSCTFCDWGSAIGTRIRQFSLSRVYAELEWCAQNQIAGVMMADANFGIFDRDVEIAAKVAELKTRYGYPNGFSCSAAKNTTTHTKKIIEILAEVGVISKGSIGVQSTDPATLAAVKRSNIRLDKYDELAGAFRQVGLPLWADLMLGLPGQTFASFKNDLQGCISRGVFPRVFMTELLVNSPMNEPSYRAEFKIVTEPSPEGNRNLVVETSTFSREEFEGMNRLRLMFILFDAIGMLRQIAHYVRSETGIREIDFYDRLCNDIFANPDRWPLMSFSVRALPGLLVPPGSWDSLLREAKGYVVERLGVPDDSALETVLQVQRAVLPVRGREFPCQLDLAHDYVSWHRAIVRNNEAGRQGDWQRVVPRLRSLGPGNIAVEDPDQLCALGIGATVDGDLFGNYELRSPIARWSSPMTSANNPLTSAS